MKKRRKEKKKDYTLTKILIAIIIILALISLFKLLGNWNINPDEGINENTNTENNLSEKDIPKENYATLYFYDEKTLCPLNGEIYFEDKLIGQSGGGNFLLSKTDYDALWDYEIKIKGLTDSCFGRNENLPFVEYWTISSLDYYFENDKQLEFKTELNPRWPAYPEAMQGFIRPYEVEERFLKIPLNENDSDLENLETLFKYTYMNYVSDKGKFGEIEYWQTPQEFINNKGGDCEDWAIYTASLTRKYNPNLDCYAAVWLTHVNVLCVVENKFIILDQEKVKKTFTFDNELIIQDNEVNAHKWINSYFDAYGITPSERKIFYLFNEKELIEFEDRQTDFFDWIIDKGLDFYSD